MRCRRADRRRRGNSVALGGWHVGALGAANELRRRNTSASYSGLHPTTGTNNSATTYEKRDFPVSDSRRFVEPGPIRASSQFDDSTRTVGCICWTYGLILLVYTSPC